MSPRRTGREAPGRRVSSRWPGIRVGTMESEFTTVMKPSRRRAADALIRK